MIPSPALKKSFFRFALRISAAKGGGKAGEGMSRNLTGMAASLVAIVENNTHTYADRHDDRTQKNPIELCHLILPVGFPFINHKSNKISGGLNRIKNYLQYSYDDKTFPAAAGNSQRGARAGRDGKCYFGLMGTVVPMRGAVKVFEIDKNHSDNTNETDNHIQNCQLIHQSLLLFGRYGINNNTKTYQKQSGNYSPSKIDPRKRRFNDNAEDEYSKAQFGRVIKEFRQVIPNVLFHGKRLYEKRRGGVENYLQYSYDDKTFPAAAGNSEKGGSL